MNRLKNSVRQINYRTIVTSVFFVTIIISGIGSLYLSLEYVSVYDTANKFNPQVSRILKAAPNSTTRIISIEVPVQNTGSRLIQIEGYAFFVDLNGETIALRETFEDIFIAPGQQDTLWGNFTYTNSSADPIIDAESSGDWNWYIRYPMRVYVGGRLYVVYQHFIMEFTGVEEVT